MAGNTPTLATENQGIRETPKSSALSKTVAGIALASSLALSGGAEAGTSPEIAALSEEYKVCVASAAETTKKSPQSWKRNRVRGRIRVVWKCE